ncbi:Rossmann-like and DUF2520 domain-containing protein [Aurantiacibacter poecillastricola]|uniref:Rossmann-like and DUF2520 domain-containing protein n=1 Tax=Aurantiacibacter poecillastricola TaxID=3064385 RepID=UPI00273D252E|nr:Rossmann-like and DUF2520 domain-containing protein [Aurantiacibacter sp. 219JJ12-13]MDP5263146.1 DUF2520 domain-containing protein [Aurantiacibacter sp. 219JJ12-13]
MPVGEGSAPRYVPAMQESAAYRRIGILGTGRVACALGGLLAEHSREDVLLWGRTPAHVDRAVQHIASARAAGSIAEVARSCDAVLIAVSDDAIAPVAEMLAQDLTEGAKMLAMHVSGRCGLAPLSPLVGKGARVAAIHPVMTFTGNAQRDRSHVPGARFAVTADTPATEQEGVTLVELLGGKGFTLSDEHRILYHAALCHAANHLVTLMEQSRQMMEAAGVDNPAGVVAPLVRAALENSLTSGFDALSGPLLRGDRETIDRHLEAIGESAPKTGEAYRALARATLDELKRSGRSVHPRLRDLLDG